MMRLTSSKPADHKELCALWGDLHAPGKECVCLRLILGKIFCHHTQKLNVLDKSVRRKKVVAAILTDLEIATITQYFLDLWGSGKKSVKGYRQWGKLAGLTEQCSIL